MAGTEARLLSPARDYFGEVRDAAELAAERAGGWIERDLRIADAALRLRFAGPVLLDALYRPLAHLESEPAESPVTISLFDSASTGAEFPTVPWSRDSLDPRGCVREPVGYGIVAYHTVHFGAITLFDRATRTGFYWVESPAVIPWYELGSPLRTALHLALPAENRHLVHAGAVGLDGAGVLIGGRSGSGKSTLTLACVEAGFGYAGDDYVLVTLEPAPVAHTLYTTAKVDPDGLARLSTLSVRLDTRASSPDKALLDLRGSVEILDSVPIVAVVLPRVRGGVSELHPVGPADAFRGLSPSTILQMPHRSSEVLETTKKLLTAVPSYRLELGDDLPEAVRLVRELVA